MNKPILAAIALAALPLAANCAESALPAYVPQPVNVPKDAPYVMRDGSIRIVGNDGMKAMLEGFNELFARTHPGFRFTMLLEGSSTAIGGLTAGVSAFAPMGREAWPSELGGFHDFFGYQPVDVHIGYGGFSHARHKNPPAIYVNKANPLAGLTLEQVARIMTSGSAKGDITHWRQLGVGGKWAQHTIHIYGPPDDGGLATSVRTSHMGKLPFASRYETLAKSPDVLDAVAGDVYGMALAGFADAAKLNPNVRLVPLARSEGAPFADASYDNVAAGRYPYVPYLRIYVNRAPGRPLDPFVKEYLRMVLSREGQAIIAAQKDAQDGYVPLDQAELERARGLLD
ncbi:MAG: PstS family phosphate ABC transporter substrate-binding protein [Telluria sp.]